MWGIDDTQEQWDDQIDRINTAIINKAIEVGVSKDVLDT